MIWFALALLALGALLGGGGMRRLGRIVRGPWKPGVSVLGVLAVFAALALAARAQWIAAVVALLVAAAALSAARASRVPPRPIPRRAPPDDAGVDRREAARILGVANDASPAQIEAAYRRLMRFAHPDAGGTAGLAARLNAARDAMLRR